MCSVVKGNFVSNSTIPITTLSCDVNGNPNICGFSLCSSTISGGGDFMASASNACDNLEAALRSVSSGPLLVLLSKYPEICNLIFPG